MVRNYHPFIIYFFEEQGKMATQVTGSPGKMPFSNNMVI